MINWYLYFFFSYLSKLSDAVKTDVVKKNEYDELVKKVTDIDTSGFVKKQNMILRWMRLKTKYPVGLA